jgi:hypothetical protein
MLKELKKAQHYPDNISNLRQRRTEAPASYTEQAPFELGFRQVMNPRTAWQVLRLVPGVFITVGSTLATVSWINRKDRLKTGRQTAVGEGD